MWSWHFSYIFKLTVVNVILLNFFLSVKALSITQTYQIQLRWSVECRTRSHFYTASKLIKSYWTIWKVIIAEVKRYNSLDLRTTGIKCWLQKRIIGKNCYCSIFGDSGNFRFNTVVVGLVNVDHDPVSTRNVDCARNIRLLANFTNWIHHVNNWNNIDIHLSIQYL